MNATMDVSETDQAVEVRLDLPGVSADEVDIQIDDGTLVVKGERREEYKDEDEDKRQFHRVERRVGKFARTIRLPSRVNDAEAVAEFKDGILKIVLPKTDEAKPTKIPVKK